MAAKKKQTRSSRDKKKSDGIPRIEHPTLGLLITELDYQYENDLLVDLATVAQARDAKLLCFVGGALGSASPTNVVYDLIVPKRIDGLLISSTVSHTMSADSLDQFCQRYAPIPIVGGALGVESVPQVLPDSMAGMRQAVEHLIQVHGYQRIAFIRGPAGQFEAEERYQAYTEALATHNIPFDPALIVQGNYGRDSGTSAMARLLDREIKLDAVVAANDDMAIGALDLLLQHGIRVPEDIALVGFDDVELARNLSVPLTTVRQMFREIAEVMIDLLLRQLHGEKVPLITKIPTELVIRRSCGCLPESVQRACLETAQFFEDVAPMSTAEVPEDVPVPLWNALLDELTGTEEGHFLRVCDQTVRQIYEEGGDIAGLQSSFTKLRHHGLRYRVEQCRQRSESLDGQTILHIENLIQPGRVLVAEAAQRFEGALRLAYKQRIFYLQRFSQAMTTAMNFEEIVSAAGGNLPLLQIARGYVVLYEDPENPVVQAKLLLSHDERGAEFHPDGAKYPSRDLLPDDVWGDTTWQTAIVLPLAMREQQLGFALVEFGPQEGLIYDQIGEQFSGAIFRSLLLQRQQAAQRDVEQLLRDVQRRALLLTGAAEISRATTSITDLSDLLSQSVNLIRDRFGLYYVGVFLLDENRHWAVLRAGTGEPGRLMLERGHRLEFGGTSMIGNCVAMGKAQITFDAAHEAMHRANPLLPDTRSEMALPLISRDRVIGAMTIQSTEPGAFSEADITALQTMADQLANAIENARLFQEMEQSRRELEIASGRYTQESWEQFVQGAGRELGYRYRLVDIEPFADCHPEARAALNQRESVFTNLVPGQDTQGVPARSALGVPIRLRDQVLGVLDLRFEDEAIPSEAVELIEQVADRLAISLESARLLQETLSAAERERLTGQVTSQMRESLEVDAVVRTATQQILEVMDLSSVTIRLASQSQKSGSGIENAGKSDEKA